jgi:hypothetical protein
MWNSIWRDRDASGSGTAKNGAKSYGLLLASLFLALAALVAVQGQYDGTPSIGAQIAEPTEPDGERVAPIARQPATTEVTGSVTTKPNKPRRARKKPRKNVAEAELFSPDGMLQWLRADSRAATQRRRIN